MTGLAALLAGLGGVAIGFGIWIMQATAGLDDVIDGALRRFKRKVQQEDIVKDI